MSNKRIIIYAVIAVLCVIIIGGSVYFQFFYSVDRPILFSGEETKKADEIAETEELKLNFNRIFNNSLKQGYGDITNINKIDESKDIIYAMYVINLHSENKYDINLNLPRININSSTAKKINKEIDNIFGSKANSVVQSNDSLSIYNVDYVAYLQDNVLSLIIKSTLKEGNYPQRVIIKTYNYDIATDSEIGLGSFFLKKNLNKNDVYKKVIDEIDKVNSQNDALTQVGLDAFKRDRNDKRYLPENTDTYFIDLHNNLYLIYAYGNNSFTSELDMVIF